MLNEKFSYQIIRSKRRTITLEIRPNGRLIVRAPLRLSEARINRFVEEKSQWILKNMEKIQQREIAKESVKKLSLSEKKQLQEKQLHKVVFCQMIM